MVYLDFTEIQNPVSVGKYKEGAEQIKISKLVHISRRLQTVDVEGFRNWFYILAHFLIQHT